MPENTAITAPPAETRREDIPTSATEVKLRVQSPGSIMESEGYTDEPPVETDELPSIEAAKMDRRYNILVLDEIATQKKALLADGGDPAEVNHDACERTQRGFKNAERDKFGKLVHAVTTRSGGWKSKHSVGMADAILDALAPFWVTVDVPVDGKAEPVSVVLDPTDFTFPDDSTVFDRLVRIVTETCPAPMGGENGTFLAAIASEKRHKVIDPAWNTIQFAKNPVAYDNFILSCASLRKAFKEAFKEPDRINIARAKNRKASGVQPVAPKS